MINNLEKDWKGGSLMDKATVRLTVRFAFESQPPQSFLEKVITPTQIKQIFMVSNYLNLSGGKKW